MSTKINTVAFLSILIIGYSKPLLFNYSSSQAQLATNLVATQIQLPNQIPNEDSTGFNEPQKESPEITPRITFKESSLSLAVLTFGVIILFLEFFLLVKFSSQVNAQNILIFFTVTLIVVGTLFLISAGISPQQISPALGLFGTIVGYLLGRESAKANNTGEIPPNQDESIKENERRNK